ncbi:hypothetical protein P9112_005784 [Eukaryota sp. TZLM1-RC]
MLTHVLFTISPIVLETFKILEGVDPRKPSAVLSYLLSFCQSEDPALSSFTSSEAIASYKFHFLKIVRFSSSSLPKSAKMKFFINGIRPDKLCFVLRTDVDTEIIDSFSSLISHLRELLSSYHFPYSAYYTVHNFAPPLQRSQPPHPNPRTPQAHRASNKSYSARSASKHSPSFRTPQTERKYFSL